MGWLAETLQVPIVLWILLAMVLLIVGRFLRTILAVALHFWLWLSDRRGGRP